MTKKHSKACNRNDWSRTPGRCSLEDQLGDTLSDELDGVAQERTCVG